MLASFAVIAASVAALSAEAADGAPGAEVDAPIYVVFVGRSHIASDWVHLATNMDHSRAKDSLHAIEGTMGSRCRERAQAIENCRSEASAAYVRHLNEFVSLWEVKVRPLEGGQLAYTLHFRVEVTGMERKLCELTKSDVWCAPAPRPPER